MDLTSPESGGEHKTTTTTTTTSSPSFLDLLSSPGGIDAGLKWMDGMLTGKKPTSSGGGGAGIKKVIKGKGV